MKKTLGIPTKLGLQAAFAVAAAVVIAQLFHLPRAYWAILTALLLISATWGESLKKAAERIAMTIFGGLVGTALYMLVSGSPTASLSILFLSIFFTIFFLQISYLIAVFFITLLVVFLFAQAFGWDMQMLVERIYETLIGAGVAIFASAFVFPIRAKDSFSERLQAHLTLHQQALQQAFAVIQGEFEQTELMKTRNQLIKSSIALRSQARVISYELFYTQYNRRFLKIIVQDLFIMMHYLSSLIEVPAELILHDAGTRFKAELSFIQKVLSDNAELVKKYFLAKTTEKIDLETIIPQVQALQNRIATQCFKKPSDSTIWFDFYSFLYFCEKFNELQIELIKKVQSQIVGK